MRSRAVAIGLAIAAVCLATASCALLSPPKHKPVEKAMLDQVPPDVPHRDSHSNTLLVFPPQTASIYDTKQMAYRTQPHEVAYFSEREWGETPSEMLRPLLVKTLEKTGAFDAVLTAPYTGRYTRALRTEILELMQDFTSQPATLVLTLRFQLTDYEGQQVLGTREVAVRKPIEQGTSYAGVVAANEATVEALRQVAAFALEKGD